MVAVTPELLTALVPFGPWGLVIWYLIQRENREAEKREKIDLARAEADKALAGSLSALTVMIQHSGASGK